MTLNPGLLTSTTPEWYTPSDLAGQVAAFFGGRIGLDPCADPGRRLPAVAHYVFPGEDGLLLPWRSSVFVNPPYGRAIAVWVNRFLSQPFEEGVLLVPSRTGSAWFQPLYDHTILFLAGRLRFAEADGHPGRNSAPFDSVLVYRGPAHRAQMFADRFGHLGRVVSGGIALHTATPVASVVPVLDPVDVEVVCAACSIEYTVQGARDAEGRYDLPIPMCPRCGWQDADIARLFEPEYSAPTSLSSAVELSATTATKAAPRRRASITRKVVAAIAQDHLWQ